MSYNFANRLDYVGTRMSELQDNSLVYKRGSTSITVSNFTPVSADVVQQSVHGIMLVTEKGQDFIFNASDLSSLDPVTPLKGDTLTWDSKVFEVMSVDDSVYSYVTSSRTRIRVHTKQVE